MGKRKHLKSGAGDVINAPGPLMNQVEKEAATKNREKPRGTIKKLRKDDEYVPEKMSLKILREASKQRKDEEEEEAPAANTELLLIKEFGTRSKDFNDGEDEVSGSAGDDDTKSQVSMATFLHTEDTDRSMREFASNVLHRIDSKRKEYTSEFQGDPADPAAGLSPNVVQMYRDIGEYMSKYRSGKIPKGFKSIPVLLNWEQILEITCPDKYTAAAMLHATRLFAANGSPKATERFYRYYLLPRILDDIAEYRRLNVQLFGALQKAVFKPAPFVKGFLLPLCLSDDLTLNVAVVIRAALTSVSLPVFHAATAMIKISALPITTPVTYVITGLIRKRYSLPSMAVNALLGYFHSYNLDEEMPLSLMSAILIFVEYYKLEISEEQRNGLLKLLIERGHSKARGPIIAHLDGVADLMATRKREAEQMET